MGGATEGCKKKRVESRGVRESGGRVGASEERWTVWGVAEQRGREVGNGWGRAGGENRKEEIGK